MLSTGDVQGCLRKLETLLRVIKYQGCVDYNGLSKGDPLAFLPIVSFTLTSFSPPFTEQLMAAGLELTGKTDLRFTDTLYKVLRDVFHYKPILTKQQFLQWGFSQRKISVICDIINLVLQKHNQLKKVDQCKHSARLSTQKENLSRTGNPNPAMQSTGRHCGEQVEPEFQPRVKSPASHKDGREEAQPTLTDADSLSAVEGRLSALEAQIESLLSGLDRLRILEKRLEELERWKNTDKTRFQNGGEVITICKESWENLMSRVLLLETKLELSNVQLNVAPPPPASTTSSSMSAASKEDIKEKLESITNMLKITSSLLKNTDSSTSPCN
ncbi:centrosomal protein of 44 kDa isoform X1 [Seriola aureovittata]|uniref:centrosomal protein of 44 kDa isoform X1 n=1 Tax=Seriola aureovittata TaxID=2871759 RepID=UPI0024BECE8F|nr:centrosomal protein of 44 kDa isoform X1 [Seriola aureovittata]